MFFTVGELMKELAKHDPDTEIKVLTTHEDEYNNEVGYTMLIDEIEECDDKTLLMTLYHW